MSVSWQAEEIAHRIFGILRDDLIEVGGDFSITSNLIESGLDSLALTQLLLAIEELTGVWVHEGLLTPEVLENSMTLANCVYEIIESR